ncbi:MAG: DUF4112 domain-containing protein [Acidobacteriota bacterium]
MPGSKVFIPEVIEPDEKLPPDLVALRRFAYFMDEAVRVPGTRMRFGLDAALGVVPGIGDAIAGLLSTWIIIGALRHRVPIVRVARMVLYVALDITIGSVPILGDVFDFVFEENVINLNALLRYRDRSRPPRALHEIAFSGIVVVGLLAGLALAMIAALIIVVIWLIGKR